MQDDFKRPLGDTVKEQPVVEPAVERTQPPVMVAPKKKHSKAFSFVSILLLLAILGAGVLAYFWYDTSEKLAQVNSEKSSLAADNAALTADASGKTPENQPATDPGDTPVSSTDDKAVITQVVTARFKAPVSAKDNKVVVNIMKQGSEFAYVAVGFENSEGVANILKKVDGMWTVIYAGQDKVSQADIQTYGIPVEYQSGQ